MKFVMSYSCGKDSTLALHKMVEQGHIPVALLVMFNQDQERSWFHGVDRPLLEQIAASLELPLLLCPSSGEEYHLAFEEGLRRAMEMGAGGRSARETFFQYQNPAKAAFWYHYTTQRESIQYCHKMKHAILVKFHH